MISVKTAPLKALRYDLRRNWKILVEKNRCTLPREATSILKNPVRCNKREGRYHPRRIKYFSPLDPKASDIIKRGACSSSNQHPVGPALPRQGRLSPFDKRARIKQESTFPSSLLSRTLFFFHLPTGIFNYLCARIDGSLPTTFFFFLSRFSSEGRAACRDFNYFFGGLFSFGAEAEPEISGNELYYKRRGNPAALTRGMAYKKIFSF